MGEINGQDVASQYNGIVNRGLAKLRKDTGTKSCFYRT